MALTPSQRHAQRSLVGTLNLRNAMWFEIGTGLCIWRGSEADAEDRGSEVLSGHLDALDIPYSMRREVAIVRGRRQAGFTIIVSWEDLEVLTRWVPSFQKQIDGVRAQADVLAFSDDPNA